MNDARTYTHSGARLSDSFPRTRIQKYSPRPLNCRKPSRCRVFIPTMSRSSAPATDDALRACLRRERFGIRDLGPLSAVVPGSWVQAFNTNIDPGRAYPDADDEARCLLGLGPDQKKVVVFQKILSPIYYVLNLGDGTCTVYRYTLTGTLSKRPTLTADQTLMTLQQGLFESEKWPSLDVTVGTRSGQTQRIVLANVVVDEKRRVLRFDGKWFREAGTIPLDVDGAASYRDNRDRLQILGGNLRDLRGYIQEQTTSRREGIGQHIVTPEYFFNAEKQSFENTKGKPAYIALSPLLFAMKPDGIKNIFRFITSK